MGTDIVHRVGDEIRFQPKKGKPRNGKVEGISPYSGTVIVLLEGDPFPVEVKQEQVSGTNTCQKVPHDVPSLDKKVLKSKKGRKHMTDEAPTPGAKELRKQAQALGIKGWEDMGRKKLLKAITKAEKESPAKSSDKKSSEKAAPKTTTPKASAEEKPKVTKPKAATKKTTGKSVKAAAKKSVAKPTAKPKAAKKAAPSKKAPTKKVAAKKKIKAEPKPGSDEALGLTFAKNKPAKKLPPEGTNPFRKSANLYIIADLLLKGGTRKALAERLSKKVKLHPYNKKSNKVALKDYDKRITLGAQTMRDVYGFGIQSTGRGLDGKIKAFIPGGPNDPRGKKNTAKSKPAAKASKKK